MLFRELLPSADMTLSLIKVRELPLSLPTQNWIKVMMFLESWASSNKIFGLRATNHSQKQSLKTSTAAISGAAIILKN